MNSDRPIPGRPTLAERLAVIDEKRRARQNRDRPPVEPAQQTLEEVADDAED